MRAVDASLAEAGFDASSVHREDFGATEEEVEENNGNLFEALLTVQIKGAKHTVAVKGRESLLSAMLRAGLTVPHGCKLGECASCICLLEEGKVERLDNAVLDDDDVADGWLVACRTRALSEEISIRFR